MTDKNPGRRLITLSVAALFVCVVAVAASQGVKTSIDIENLFNTSGWMGDGEFGRKYVNFSAADPRAPHSAPTCIRVEYSVGSNRWAGMYWQNLPDNWGDRPGNDYSGHGLSRVTFLAKGELGTEVVEFKAGGINKPSKKYRDSFTATTGRVNLSKEWTQYEIALSGLNLTSVIGGFCWVVSRDSNRADRVTFYLDDIRME
jgi:hypothetical protein